MNEIAIAEEYERIARRIEADASQWPEYFVQMTRDHAGGLWREYAPMLEEIPVSLAGRRVLDFGCKFGHLLPLLIASGSAEAIGLDAAREYVETGQRAFAPLYPNLRILETTAGYMPLQPDSVDVIIMNEVISHVNPAFLDTVWAEASRVLVPGGVLFISDGNNGANAENRAVLPSLYRLWELGPEGARTDRDVVTAPFRARRVALIRARHPHLPIDRVETLADNTSGMFGEALAVAVDGFVAGGELIRRPYREGRCPASPDAGGFVMERAFSPLWIELSLDEHGFDARQIYPGARKFRQRRPGWTGLARDAVAFARARWRAARLAKAPRGFSRGFQIVATKR